MLTFKLKIESVSDSSFLKDKRTAYEYAGRHLLAHFDEPDIEARIRSDFGLDSWEYASLYVEIEGKIKANASLNDERKIRIFYFEKQLQELKAVDKKSKGLCRKIFNLKKKIAKNVRRLDSYIVFGGVQNLRNISHYSNCLKSLSSEQVEEKIHVLEMLEKSRKAFHDKRSLPVVSSGEAYHNGNRKFDFDLLNRKLVYKPFSGKKIEIVFCPTSKKRIVVLGKLQELADQNETIPLNVHLSEKYVFISYDEQAVAGFSFNTKEYKKRKKLVVSEEERKKLSREFYREQETRMFADKDVNIYAGVDLNPCYIGFSIVDASTNQILFENCYDIKKLSEHLGVPSCDDRQIYQNNKRKHEIIQIWKDVFKICIRFKASHFVMEDLNFKNSKLDKGSEFNRITRNVWHRDLTEKQIKKHCNMLGIKLLEVGAQYSSFIGNFRYDFYDPVNASLEIVRRGVKKFVKGCSLYPEFSGSDADTMSRFVSERNKSRDDLHDTMQVLDSLKSCKTWLDSYNVLKSSKIKDWRKVLGVENSKAFRFFSIKSNVMELTFFNKNFNFIA